MKELLSNLRSVIRLRSLRARIFLIILVLGIVPCILVRVTIVSDYESRAVETRVSSVQNQLTITANHLVANKYISALTGRADDYTGSLDVMDAEIEMLSNVYEGRIMIIGANFKVLKDTYGISEGKTIISEEVIKCFQGVSTSYYDKNLGYIELTTPIADTTAEGGSGVIRGVMLTSISDDSIISMADVLGNNAFILEITIIILVAALAAILSKFLVSPISTLTGRINAVKAGYNNFIEPVEECTETAHISEAFNNLLTRINALDESRGEFVANVSHELKTPMASMKVLSDSLLASPDASVEDYREFMEDITSQIDRENRIITDLLALVKMDDTSSQNLKPVPTDINELTELVLKRLRSIARKQNVDVTFETKRKIIAEVDEVKITSLITNLVENAIKYNHENGWVRVSLDADHQDFKLTVEDSGLGIPEESQAHIYERFYRVDKSHSREIGGTGLGLAICRKVVLMHHGNIDLTSKEGEGSKFVVTIPLSYIADAK
ncbi:MAG: two-component sensor histidine kinase [Lachnospiraceae bacterium]|nr:two-component sensor histidine kinase [Lachnospiraceae bacterium]